MGSGGAAVIKERGSGRYWGAGVRPTLESGGAFDIGERRSGGAADIRERDSGRY